MDTIDIGSVPNAEPCLQVGDPRVSQSKMCTETLAYKHQLERTYPRATFVIRSNDHDFGVYFSVEAVDDQAGLEAESGCENWDEDALAEIQEIISNYKELVQ